MKTKLTLAVAVIVTGAMLGVAGFYAQAPKTAKVAVFGRTLCALMPELPGCHSVQSVTPLASIEQMHIQGIQMMHQAAFGRLDTADTDTPVHPKVKCPPNCGILAAWMNDPNRTWDGHIRGQHWRTL